MVSFRGALALFSFGVVLAQAPVQLVKVASGFTQPTHIADAGDSSGRLFVVEQPGRIRVIRNGTVLPTPFLDISGRVICCGERGLLSVAFPPGRPPKPEFYVYYTDPVGDVTISRFAMTAARDAGDPASETVLLKIDHRQFPNHNGGQLVFGPDGFLYAGTGDGGGGGDPLDNGQNTNALLGKLLRIDVESGAQPYGVPASNPFVKASGFRPEIWAYGLRNPWRFSFDRATGDLYIADVGQDLYEEVDFQPASAGGQNYGWNIMEGFHCYQAGCSSAGLTLPVAEYSHGAGDCSITGGFVYRGAQYPALQGTYFYADYCTGHLWGLTRTGGAWKSTLLLNTGLAISSFGEDEAGEVYLADQGRGDIYRLTSAGAAAAQITAIVDAAAFGPGISPGSLATIFGQGITSVTGIVNAGATPLPADLAGTSVVVNGVAAPLLAVADVNGREQVNFQVPFEIPPLGTASIAVKNGGSQTAPAPADVMPAHPALFTTDGAHAAAQHGADYKAISVADPAASNEVILLYGTGLGPVDNPPATGAATLLSPLSPTTTTPAVTIGGTAAVVEFAGLTPLSVGLYQINVRVPAGLAQGERDVVVTIGGDSSKPVKIFVR